MDRMMNQLLQVFVLYTFLYSIQQESMYHLIFWNICGNNSILNHRYANHTNICTELDTSTLCRKLFQASGYVYITFEKKYIETSFRSQDGLISFLIAFYVFVIVLKKEGGS